ncbi:MAG: purine-nucleoside phosphorylase [Saprospiraceae bacterium]
MFDQVKESAEFIKSKIPDNAKHAIILGTGLGGFADNLIHRETVLYKDIPHFPVSTVQSHEGKLIFGFIKKAPILVMSGRLHYYEGYSAKEVTFPIRVLKELGIDHIIVTNAAGGINPHYSEGDIVMINDHINMMPDHPLRGQNDQNFGPRFPDMLDAYDLASIKTFELLAKKSNTRLHTGVYLGLQGPSLETPAEYKMAHILGADLVGMSTIPEVIVARHQNMKVSAFSIVSNVCFPASKLSKTTVEDVIKTVNQSAGRLENLLLDYFTHISDE